MLLLPGEMRITVTVMSEPSYYIRGESPSSTSIRPGPARRQASDDQRPKRPAQFLIRKELGELLQRPDSVGRFKHAVGQALEAEAGVLVRGEKNRADIIGSAGWFDLFTSGFGINGLRFIQKIDRIRK
jgi:hypothetical protein